MGSVTMFRNPEHAEGECKSRQNKLNAFNNQTRTTKLIIDESEATSSLRPHDSEAEPQTVRPQNRKHQKETQKYAFKVEKNRKVERFLSASRLTSKYDLALELIHEHIPGVIEVRLNLHKDTIIGIWLEIYVVVDADLDSLTKAEDELLDEWLAKTSVKEGQQIRIDFKFAK